jgi:outer membrane receptor protein involved in Fe transport
MAAFYMVWKNVQSDQLLPNGLSYTANIGDGRDLGLEAEAEIQPDDHWRLKANATVAEPELTRPNPAFLSRPDNGLPGAPRFSAGAFVSYRRPITQAIDLQLRGRYAYVGGSHLTLDATVSPAMGDYSYAELSAGLGTARWSVTVFATAPVGGPGDTFAYGDPFSFRNLAQTTPLRPATFGVTLSARTP